MSAAIIGRRSPVAGLPIPGRLGPWIEELAVRLSSKTTGPAAFVSFAAVSPNSGTTSIACAVAERMQSALGRRVLLVDADTRSPHLHELFRAPNSAGLADVLRGRSSLRDAIRTVSPSGLSLMTAGTPHAESPSLIDSDAFETMKGYLREYFEHVIFDCPALQSDTGSLILAKRVDGMVLVLRAEQTRWESGGQLIERLRSTQVNVLGAVLNRKRFYIPHLLYKRL